MRPTRYICKAKAEYLGGSRVRWIWPCGHTRTQDLVIGPKGPNSVQRRRPLNPELLRKMVSYWNAAGGINSPECPTCKGKQGARK